MEKQTTQPPRKGGYDESAARLALLAAIVDSSDDAVMAKNLDGTITSWNPAAERIYGYKAAEIIGKPVSLLTHPDHPNEMVDILERIRRGERIEHYETTRVPTRRAVWTLGRFVAFACCPPLPALF